MSAAERVEDGNEVREMLTTEQVLELLPISRTTLLRMERDGEFPQGLLVTRHKKCWFKSDVIAWQKGLHAANRPAG